MFRFSISRSFANIPKESPFCVECRRTFRQRFVLLVVMSKSFTVISRFLHKLWCCTYLVMFFRMNLWNFLSFVKVMPSSCKVFLDHLAINFIVLFVNMRVFHYNYSIKMKRLSSLSTFLFPSFLFIDKFLNINRVYCDFHMNV
jgi:hypothetical protein